MAAVGIAGRLQLGDHVCVFVDDVRDGLDVMAQTVVAGLDAGQKVMVFTSALLPVAVLAGVQARGVTVPQDGRVQVLSAREAYPPTGRFEPTRILDALVGHIEQAAADGFAGVRLVGDMTWALDGPAGVEQLAAYEAHVNQLYVDGRALGICLYDRRAFRAGLLRQVAEAHPAMSSPAAGADWAPLLRIRRTVDPYGLRLTGEADLSNRRALAWALDAVLDQQPDPATPILIDVAGLRYADADTAGLLGRLALRAPAGVHLTGARTAVETVLHRVGVLQLSKVRLTRVTGGGSSETEMVA